MRERFEAGGSAEDYLYNRTKLADSTVVGLVHIASISNGIRDRSTVAPLAAIAVGGYGRGELAPGSDLDLLFLLPEGNQACARGVAPTIKACISAVVASLWDLGFELDHAARSPCECLELASDDAAFLAGLVDRRFLWGGFGLFTSSRRSSLVLTQDAGGTRSATPCQALIAVRRAKCNVWRTSLTSSEAPAACETCGAQSGPIRPHRRVPCRSRKRRLSKRTVSCGLCGVICIFSRVAQTTVLACHSNPATRYKTPLRLTCWTFSVITPAMFWLRSVLRRLPSLEYKLDIGNRIVDF